MEGWTLFGKGTGAANGLKNAAVQVGGPNAGSANGYVTLQQQFVTDSARISLRGASLSDSTGMFTVPVRRLDAILKEENVHEVALLKIDVEGYEPEVISGLGSVRPAHIIFEIDDPSSARGHSLCQGLRDMGYVLRTVDGNFWTQGKVVERNLWASS